MDSVLKSMKTLESKHGKNDDKEEEKNQQQQSNKNSKKKYNNIATIRNSTHPCV